MTAQVEQRSEVQTLPSVVAGAPVPIFQVEPGEDDWLAVPMDGRTLSGPLAFVVVGLDGVAHCGCPAALQRLPCLHALAAVAWLRKRHPDARPTLATGWGRS